MRVENKGKLTWGPENKQVRHIHFVGIGGSGMSALALLSAQLGFKVTGSDLKPVMGGLVLQSKGTLECQVGHEAAHINGADLVVYSSAISENNIELEAARSSGIPVIRRALYLAQLGRLRKSLTVCGAHGKTTTTAMVAHVMIAAGWDPSVVIGGRLLNFESRSAIYGSGDWLVAEADESDGTLGFWSPHIAVVTNLDHEHLNYYGTFENLRAAFEDFCARVPFYGAAIINDDDTSLRSCASGVAGKVMTFGLTPHADIHLLEYQAERTGKSMITLRLPDHTLLPLSLGVPGRHNALNAAACIAACSMAGIEPQTSAQALQSFQGVGRRLEKKGEMNGVILIDDYAHHPTEVRATLAALRDRYPKSTLRVVFQPHRYSRVANLLYEFSRCFEQAHEVAVTNIYGAGEIPLSDLTSHTLVREIARHHPSVWYESPAQQAWESLQKRAQPGDLIVTLGAGDIQRVYASLSTTQS